MPAKDGDTYTLVWAKGQAPHPRAFQVETVVSPLALQKGLSGRQPLASGHGMLFVFPALSVQSMWMPDMRFSLDIVWLDENLEVVHITYNTPPCQPGAACPSYSSQRLVKYAIEMRAGDAAAYSFKGGDRLLVQ